MGRHRHNFATLTLESMLLISVLNNLSDVDLDEIRVIKIRAG